MPKLTIDIAPQNYKDFQEYLDEYNTWDVECGFEARTMEQLMFDLLVEWHYGREFEDDYIEQIM